MSEANQLTKQKQHRQCRLTRRQHCLLVPTLRAPSRLLPRAAHREPTGLSSSTAQGVTESAAVAGSNKKRVMRSSMNMRDVCLRVRELVVLPRRCCAMRVQCGARERGSAKRADANSMVTDTGPGSMEGNVYSCGGCELGPL